MNRKRLLAKFYIRGLEEYASILDVVRLPKLSKLGMRRFYGEANRIRRKIGEKPRKYYTVEGRKLVEVKT